MAKMLLLPRSLCRMLIGVVLIGASPSALGQGGEASPSATQGFIVVDARGKAVGQLVERNLVQRQVNGTWVSFPFGYSGLKSEGLILYFATKNCSGQAYMNANDSPLRGVIFTTPGAGSMVSDGYYTASGALVFPEPPMIMIKVTSVLAVQSLSPLSGVCSEPDSKLNALVGAAATFNLGPFTPPFKLK
ncbi:hypothetical protein LG047_13135 [Methylocystis sp. WRRC1]|uniref:hypothetical protein n=1 Tax=Methylocystis sp. WRRC1 TaxID=1732014 RepID=UPI001D13CEB3|nr:hypothetical protein [Methylocystis sp. WRRC1]MCC3246252.1 hypothetical protein [Methylocystis sp. WRRC1]